jgi:putative protein kinase ArgK-like GTPase of G3E family
VLNKLDLIAEDERDARVKGFVKAYRWKGPVFAIAAINGEGCRELIYAVQDWLDAHPFATEAIDPDASEEPIVITPKPVRERTPRRRRSSP